RQGLLRQHLGRRRGRGAAAHPSDPRRQPGRVRQLLVGAARQCPLAALTCCYVLQRIGTDGSGEGSAGLTPAAVAAASGQDQEGNMRTGPGLWQGIRKAGFAVPVRPSLDVLTADLLDNLGNPDPDERALGIEILETWVRRGVYEPEALRAMGGRAADNLKVGLGEQDTDSLFVRTDSLILLKRVVEADNRSSFLEPEELQAWLDALVAYVENERDLRGYVPGKGWAHTLARAAAGLRLLALNRRLSPEAVRRILDVVGAKITAPVEEPFRYYEDEWLAYAVATIFRLKALGGHEVL